MQTLELYYSRFSNLRVTFDPDQYSCTPQNGHMNRWRLICFLHFLSQVTAFQSIYGIYFDYPYLQW